jgi:hypothetical protein
VRFLRPEYASWWQLLPVVAACCTVHALYLSRQRRLAAIPSRFRSLSRRSSWLRETAIAVLSLTSAGALIFVRRRS